MFIDAIVKREGEPDENVLINIHKVIMASSVVINGEAYFDLDVQDLNGVFKYLCRLDVFHEAVRQLKGK